MLGHSQLARQLAVGSSSLMTFSWVIGSLSDHLQAVFRRGPGAWVTDPACQILIMGMATAPISSGGPRLQDGPGLGTRVVGHQGARGGLLPLTCPGILHAATAVDAPLQAKLRAVIYKLQKSTPDVDWRLFSAGRDIGSR